MTQEEREWSEAAVINQAKIAEMAKGFCAMTGNKVTHSGMFMFKERVYRYIATVDLSAVLERAAKSGVLELDEPKAQARAATELTFTEEEI